MRTVVAIRSLLFSLFLLAMSLATFGQFGVSITIAPPALPVYEQPICPGDGYIWTPGYWAWGDDDYYWVPGTWIEAPEVGFLWTPGYWGWGDGAYLFHDGYWGPTIGFYGGIDYGFGYFGHGYEGGRWDNGHFFYNRNVNNVNVSEIHNTYNTTVINNHSGVSRVSFNGGNGGVAARATSEEEAAARGRHVGPVSAQSQHVQEARSNPQLRASANQGKPPIAATSRPGDFKTAAVPAREAGAPYKAPARAENNNVRPATENNAGRTNSANNADRPNTENNAAAARSNAVSHASDLQAHKGTPANTGNPKLDQKYQQQQDRLTAQQSQQHQKLQQQQETEHQQASQKNYNDAAKQQMEQRHQQQTQQLEQKHAAQTQQQQTRQQPRQESRPPEQKPH